MSFRAAAVTFKSKGGKGSRGVAFFSHGPGEATVHLIEDGEALCGISKNYKKSWRLTHKEARQGRARRPGWKLSVCKNCMTHLDKPSKKRQQNDRTEKLVDKSRKDASVYSTAKSHSERKEDLRNALEKAISKDSSLSGSRGQAYVRWKNPEDRIFIVRVTYKKLGSIFSRYFGAEIQFHQHPKKDYDPRKGTEVLTDIEGIHKTRNAGTTRLYTQKDNDTDVALEYQIILEIIRRTGADLTDISNVDNPI